MFVDGWKYYNHAAIPTCAPHEAPNLSVINDGSIWHVGGGTPLLARWTTDWDCGYETNWWYTIQDTKFDIMSLHSSSRRRITQGLKYFDFIKIDPKDFANEMAHVTIEDWRTYPEKYRPTTSYDRLVQSYSMISKDVITYGAFDKEDGVLSAFQLIKDNGTWYSMEQGKSLPEKQKKQVNAGLIYSYIMDLSDSYITGKYLTNGQRSISHETNFNEDLCKYYGFRKAYCRLCIAYNPKIKVFVKVLYPFRELFQKKDSNKFFHNINGIMRMEEIAR